MAKSGIVWKRTVTTNDENDNVTSRLNNQSPRSSLMKTDPKANLSCIFDSTSLNKDLSVLMKPNSSPKSKLQLYENDITSMSFEYLPNFYCYFVVVFNNFVNYLYY